MATAGAEESAAQDKAIGSLGTDINLDPQQQETIRTAAQSTQLQGATTDQIVNAIIGSGGVAGAGLTAPQSYQAEYAAQGDDAYTKTVFANEARAQAAARLMGSEGQSPLVTWEQALGVPAGTINNPDVAFGLVGRVYSPVDNEVFDTGSAVNQEVQARSQSALNAIQDIKDDIDRKGVATNTPVMQSAIAHLNRMSEILLDPDGKANDIIMKNVDTTGIDLSLIHI